MPGIFKIAVEGVVEKDGLILITKRSPERDHAPGEWETVTGRVENGETLEEGVLREVKEETGLTVAVVKPFDTFHFYRGAIRDEHQGVSFWCKYVSGDVVLDTTEQVEYKWVTPDEALTYITNENERRSITMMKELLSQ